MERRRCLAKSEGDGCALSPRARYSSGSTNSSSSISPGPGCQPRISFQFQTNANYQQHKFLTNSLVARCPCAPCSLAMPDVESFWGGRPVAAASRCETRFHAHRPQIRSIPETEHLHGITALSLAWAKLNARRGSQTRNRNTEDKTSEPAVFFLLPLHT